MEAFSYNWHLVSLGILIQLCLLGLGLYISAMMEGLEYL